MNFLFGKTWWRSSALLAVLLLTGCANWRGSAQKTSGRPLSVGISANLPLGR